MAQKLDVERIWWRNVQPGEFYNIERYPRIRGSGGSTGGGSLYIEVPKSIVTKTLDFLDAVGTSVEMLPEITITAGVIGQPGVYGQIPFQRKSGGRIRIANQNRQQPSSQRHPAWLSSSQFPSAPDEVSSTAEAKRYFPKGGLRIYIAKTFDGKYFAGHTKGPRPSTMDPNDPHWELYPEGTAVGGVIDAR